MSNPQAIAVSIIGFFIILAMLMSLRSAKRTSQKNIDLDTEWYENEKNKPRYRVEFTLKNGETYFTDPFEPYMDLPGDEFYCLKYTSFQRAAQFNRNCFERGFFVNNLEIFYPICNVKSSKVVEVKQDE